jgi:hypothetical protein
LEICQWERELNLNVKGFWGYGIWDNFVTIRSQKAEYRIRNSEWKANSGSRLLSKYLLFIFIGRPFRLFGLCRLFDPCRFFGPCRFYGQCRFFGLHCFSGPHRIVSQEYGRNKRTAFSQFPYVCPPRWNKKQFLIHSYEINPFNIDSPNLLVLYLRE